MSATNRPDVINPQPHSGEDRPAYTSKSLWLRSDANRPPLRIGLLLDGTELSALFASVIEDIQASNFANIELAVYRKTSGAVANAPSGGLFRTALRTLTNANLRKHALYSIYQRFDRRRKPAQNPLETLDCRDFLAHVDSIEVEPIGKKFVHRFPEEALKYIRAKKLDVLIRFGFNILKGEILTAARYGIWSYHHGDNDFYRGGPAHFWELCERSPLSGVILQVLSEELDGGLVLCKSLFTTQPTLSVSVNRFGPYWGASDLVIRKLNELHRLGWEHLQQNSVLPTPYQGKRKIYRTPANMDMVRWLGPVLLKKGIERPFRRKSLQHWRIGIRLNRKPLFEELDTTFEGVRWIESQKGHFWADPFALEHDGKAWAFFEDYCYRNRKGLIACAEISSEGTLVSPVPCLQSSGHHYSYPYVFRDGTELFMIPEAWDAGSVDVYRCTDFPNRWEHHATLLRGKYVDTSVWNHDGLWWLMTTSADPDSRAGILFLFFSERLTGPWHFHPANPISTDVRNNRGAGRVFFDGERWIRPSQSCCPVYGYSFSLNEITALSTTKYAERPILEFRPEMLGPFKATHTYNWISGIELIDGTVSRRVDEV